MPLCMIPGAYSGAVYHLRKVIELEPNNIMDKEHLLSFYTHPNRLISDEEAKSLVNEILEAKPDSTIAMRISNNLNK